MNKICKLFLTWAVLCAICAPVCAQDKAFKKALKNGKVENGYYRADLSKQAYTREHLSKYALENGYIIKNMKEGKVLQFGNYYTAVVSLDFLPVNEHAANNNAIADISSSQSGNSHLDETTRFLMQMIIEASVQQNSDIITVKPRITQNTNTEIYNLDNFMKAGLACGMYCFYFQKYFNDVWSIWEEPTAKFISFEDMEKRLIKQLYSSVASFTSVGEGSVYLQGAFQRKEMRWTGNCTNGLLNGKGMGYFRTDGKIDCFVGTFSNGKPVGDCKYYTFEVADLANNKPLNPHTTTNIHSFSDGMARCEVTFYKKDRATDFKTSYIDPSYTIKIDNVERIKFADNGWNNIVVKDFENGYLTLNRKVDDNFDLEFLVDKRGKYYRLTDKGYATLNALVDKMETQYNNCISKVFNPTDVLTPSAKLEKRFGYQLNLFPSGNYHKIPKLAKDDYTAKYPGKASLAEYHYNVHQLLSNISGAFEIDKGQEEGQWIRDWFHDPWGYNNPANSSRRYFYKKQKADDIINKINQTTHKPGDFNQIVSVINKEYDEYLAWWNQICSRAQARYDAIMEQKRREKEAFEQQMCDNCKIDGSQTKFPEGYYEGYSSWFFGGRPAESENDGEIVFANGARCKWKYVYRGEKSTELDYIDVSGSYLGRYKSMSEMMKDLEKQCRNRWCK